MEKFDSTNFERNPYKSYLEIKEIINIKIDSCESFVEKLDKTKTLIDIFDRLEEYLDPDNTDGLTFVKENLGVYFKDLIYELPGNYLSDLELQLKVAASSLNNPQSVDIIKLKVEEIVSTTIEKVLTTANLEFSTKLNQSQIEYLSRNEAECKNFLSILEVIGKIKKLPNVSGKMLNIQHLTASINKIKVNFRGRMTKTNNENTKKHIDLSNCVETNLSDSDRFIFSIENANQQSVNDQTILNIKVLGKPPYKHD